MRHVDIGIFAHNEERSIGDLLADLDRQTLLQHPRASLRIRILCNGCTDQTAEVACRAISASDHLGPITRVDDFERGGKSLTWNRYVSELPGDADVVIFVDADIRVRDTAVFFNLFDELQHSEALSVTSRPVKRVDAIRWNPLLRMAAVLMTPAHRDGPICGQLYAVRASAIRHIRLPVPCLVEDGFLSACLVTGLFTVPGEPEQVKASSLASHEFQAPGTFREFFRHDVRLRLGCEMNAAMYSDLWAAKSADERLEILTQFAASEGISRSLDEHERHPERSALAWRSPLRGFRENGRRNAFKSVLKLPFRFAHFVYMEAVRRRAVRLFRQRQFQW